MRFKKRQNLAQLAFLRSKAYPPVSRSLAPLKKDHLRPKSTVYTSTNNHLDWELGGTGNPLGWELGGTGVLGVGIGERGLIHGDVLQ